MGLDSGEYMRYLKAVRWMIFKNPELRIGQSYWNVFDILYTNEADIIRGGPFDCFLDDRNITGFLTYVRSVLTALN